MLSIAPAGSKCSINGNSVSMYKARFQWLHFGQGRGCDWHGACGRTSRVAGKVLFCVLNGGVKATNTVVTH